MRTGPEPALPPDEVIYEMTRLGPVVRVAAMHAPTLTEVVFHGPLGAGQGGLKRLASARLAWVLARRGAAPRG